MSWFCSLPEEALIHILSLMHPTTLVCCRAVCKLLLNLIEQTMILNYHIELYADGMVNVEGCKLTVSERLSQLRSHRQAWRDIRLENRPFPLIPGTWNAYELVDGIFSKTLNSVGSNTARGILFASLPSRHDVGSLILFEDLGITFRDFAMDPSQDLIVYMQCSRITDPTYNGLMTRVTLHFRTMSNNKTHPLAGQPTVAVMFRSEVSGAVIQTVNDIVAFMSWDDLHSHLYIWNWNRCILLVSETDLAAFSDFAFISDRAFVLTSPGAEPCFRLYTFDINTNVYEPHTSPTLRATLYLPDMHGGACAELLGIHTGPFTSASSQLFRPSKPFVTAPQARIHVVNIDLTNRSTEPAVSFLIVIRNQTFISYLNKEALDVAWEDWGPQHSRWIRGGTGSLWLRYVHGERLVRLRAGAEDGSRCLEVYDFGAPRGPRSWRTPQEDDLIHRTSTFTFDPVFTSRVSSQLPCRVTTTRELFPYSGFMVDEDRLVGLKRDWDGATSVDVFTF